MISPLLTIAEFFVHLRAGRRRRRAVGGASVLGPPPERSPGIPSAGIFCSTGSRKAFGPIIDHQMADALMTRLDLDLAKISPRHRERTPKAEVNPDGHQVGTSSSVSSPASSVVGAGECPFGQTSVALDISVTKDSRREHVIAETCVNWMLNVWVGPVGPTIDDVLDQLPASEKDKLNKLREGIQLAAARVAEAYAVLRGHHSRDRHCSWCGSDGERNRARGTTVGPFGTNSPDFFLSWTSGGGVTMLGGLKLVAAHFPASHAVTGQNLANAATIGYRRRTVELTSAGRRTACSPVRVGISSIRRELDPALAVCVGRCP